MRTDTVYHVKLTSRWLGACARIPRRTEAEREACGQGARRLGASWRSDENIQRSYVDDEPTQIHEFRSRSNPEQFLRRLLVRVWRFFNEAGSVRIVEIKARREGDTHGVYHGCRGATQRSAILALPEGPGHFLIGLPLDHGRSKIDVGEHTGLYPRPGR